MATLIVHDNVFSRHTVPEGHPENAQRMLSVAQALTQLGAPTVRAPIGTQEQVLLVHPLEHFISIQNAISATNQGHFVALDTDTFVSPNSWESILSAVGSSCFAIDMVMQNKYLNAFCAIRPPGHHAERMRPMGFCMFNNVAIAARWAINNYKLKKIAIIDFDVHHGNGTQDIFWSDSSVMYISTHQMPLYPGTGFAEDVGDFNNILNIPLESLSDGSKLKNITQNIILPRLESYRPELILISAGFDAHKDDHLGGLCWTSDDFRWLTQQLMDTADLHTNGKIVSLLEGGYHLPSLMKSIYAHVKTLISKQSFNG